MKKIDDLRKIAPPPEKAKNPGSLHIWERVKELANLPDWIFPLFHTYGSGIFAVYGGEGVVYRGEGVDFIRLLNVFEKPVLNLHSRIGTGLTEANQSVGLSVEFFPQSKDGLFPIT